MATRTWNSAGSTNGVDGNNYFPTGTIEATDDLVFNNTSVVNCSIAGVNATVNSITIAANYSGNWTCNTFTITLTQGFSADGTGTLTFGTAITCNGASATFHIGSDVGIVNASALTLTMNGTTGMTYDIDKANTYVKSLVLAASAKVTISGAQNNYLRTNGYMVTMGNGSTLTINAHLYLYPTAAGITPWSIGSSCTINGGNNIYLQTDIAGTYTIPATTIDVPLVIQHYSGAGVFNFSGNFVTGAGDLLRIVNQGATSTLTANIQNVNVTVGAFQLGSAAAGSTTFNAGSGVLTIDSYYAGGTYDLGATTVDWQTATINCAGNFTAGSNHTYTVGTSIVNITAASTITCNGKTPFYDLTINASGLTVATADDLRLSGDLTVTAGTLNISGDDVTIGGDLSLASGCTFTIDASSTLTFTGNSTITTNGKELPQTTINGNTAINDGCTIARLVWGTDGKTATFEAGQTFTISALTAANWNGSAGSLNALRSSSNGTQYTLAIPNDVTLTYMNPKDCKATGFTITADDGTSTSAGNNTGWILPVIIAAVVGSAANRTISGVSFKPAATNPTVSIGGVAATVVSSTDILTSIILGAGTPTGSQTLTLTNSASKSDTETINVSSGKQNNRFKLPVFDLGF